MAKTKHRSEYTSPSKAGGSHSLKGSGSPYMTLRGRTIKKQAKSQGTKGGGLASFFLSPKQSRRTMTSRKSRTTPASKIAANYDPDLLATVRIAGIAHDIINSDAPIDTANAPPTASSTAAESQNEGELEISSDHWETSSPQPRRRHEGLSASKRAQQVGGHGTYHDCHIQARCLGGEETFVGTAASNYTQWVTIENILHDFTIDHPNWTFAAHTELIYPNAERKKTQTCPLLHRLTIEKLIIMNDDKKKDVPLSLVIDIFTEQKHRLNSTIANLIQERISAHINEAVEKYSPTMKLEYSADDLVSEPAHRAMEPRKIDFKSP